MEAAFNLCRLGRQELLLYRGRNTAKYIRRFAGTGRLSEVGRFEDPKVAGNVYQAGQCFVHRLFGFRGVVLASWRSRLCDYSSPESQKSGISLLQPSVADRICYVALLDTLDLQTMPDIWQDAAYFLADEGNQVHIGVRRINGLAYVEHSELMPYVTNETMPIRHQLFTHFLSPTRAASSASSSNTNSNPKTATSTSKTTANASSNSGFLDFRPTNMLRQFLEDSSSWLEPGSTVTDLSENVRVSVTPFFLGELEGSKQFCWSYSVRIENLVPEEPIRLLRRFWRVFSVAGTANTWKGDGVVGRRPELYTGRPLFQYSSTVALYTSGGHMWGTYHFERTNGEEFEVRIPTFYLETNEQRKRQKDPTQSVADSSTPPTNSNEETRSENTKARKRKEASEERSREKETAAGNPKSDAKVTYEKIIKSSKPGANNKGNSSSKTGTGATPAQSSQPDSTHSSDGRSPTTNSNPDNSPPTPPSNNK